LAVIWNDFRHPPDPDLDFFFRDSNYERRSYSSTIREEWASYIRGARSGAGSPNEGDAGYAEVEAEQRTYFDAEANEEGLLVVGFTTQLAVGLL
jgi:hypothetical protein